ncbi:MAG: hypothetical protein D6798_06325 [Deltaproteobacteria bacterium]|nr:MAG: hypothetical protein D6798_06325 [Deltaproteobacteria bacterium]
MKARSRFAGSRRGDAPIGAVSAILLVLLLLGAYVIYAWFPGWWDYMAVREIAQTTVRDWGNHAQKKRAVARFEAELKRKEVSLEITPEVCDFIEEGDQYAVKCEWTHYAYYPGTDYYKAFDAYVYATADDVEARYTPR